MIDPNIALSYQPVQTPDPMQLAQQASSLRSMAGQQQLQQTQLAGERQQLAARDLQMRTLAATNKAIAAHSTTDANGKVTINHDGVVGALANEGFGQAAQQWQDEQTKRDQALTTLSTDQLLLAKKRHDEVSEALGSVEGLTGDARLAEWTRQAKGLYDSGAAPAGSIATTPPDDPTLHAYRLSTVAGRQAIASEIAARQEANREKLEEDKRIQANAAAAHTAAYEESVSGKNNAFKDTGRTQGGRMVMMDPSGNIKLGPKVDPDTGGGRGEGGGVTPTQRDRDIQSELGNYQSWQAEETKQDGLRTLISGAIQRGQYLDTKGTPVAWSRLIPQGKDEDTARYQTRLTQEKPGYMAQMSARLGSVTQAANQATSQKNDAMTRYATLTNNPAALPRVSTAQAVAARNGGQAPSAAAAAPQQQTVKEGQIIRNPQTGERRQLVKGQWQPLAPMTR